MKNMARPRWRMRKRLRESDLSETSLVNVGFTVHTTIDH